MVEFYHGIIPIENGLRKSVFPYSWFTGPEILQESTFPSIEKFYDQLKDEPLNQSDYEFGVEIWKYLESWKKVSVEVNPRKWIGEWEFLSCEEKKMRKRKYPV